MVGLLPGLGDDLRGPHPKSVLNLLCCGHGVTMLADLAAGKRVGDGGGEGSVAWP